MTAIPHSFTRSLISQVSSTVQSDDPEPICRPEPAIPKYIIVQRPAKKLPSYEHCPLPRRLAASSGSIGEKDDRTDRAINVKFADAYRRFSSKASTASACLAEAPIQDEPAVLTSNGLYFTDPHIDETFRQFYREHEPAILNAVFSLQARHPDLGVDDLLAMLTRLIHLEFMLLNETDLMQDAAAARYARMPEAEFGRLESLFSQAWGNGFAATAPGMWTWRAASAVRLDIESQAFGPLQIIPGIALHAASDPALLAAYPELSKDDFTDARAVILASFNPAKMFALKAVTFDLQLTAVKESEFIKCVFVKRPSAMPLMCSAYALVQNPEIASNSEQLASAANRAHHFWDFFETVLGFPPDGSHP